MPWQLSSPRTSYAFEKYMNQNLTKYLLRIKEKKKTNVKANKNIIKRNEPDLVRLPCEKLIQGGPQHGWWWSWVTESWTIGLWSFSYLVCVREENWKMEEKEGRVCVCWIYGDCDFIGIKVWTLKGKERIYLMGWQQNSQGPKRIQKKYSPFSLFKKKIIKRSYQ